MSITNARISSVFVGLEGHGIPTIIVQLDEHSSVQGFGGYDLRYKNMAEQWIKGLCRVTGRDNLCDMKGAFVRVERDDNSRISSIGHIVEDKWLRTSELPA